MTDLTREQVMAAVNTGADLALGAMADAGMHDEEAANVSNLVVCAIGSVLENPDATIVDVLVDNFEGTIEQWRTELGDDVVEQALARAESP